MYVDRDTTGKIIRAFARPQRADHEWIDDGPEMAAFLNPPPARAEIERMRRDRYRTESDPLFFREQRGEEEPGTWKAKVAEIRADLPYPEEGDAL